MSNVPFTFSNETEWRKYGSHYARVRPMAGRLDDTAPNGRYGTWFVAYLGEQGSNDYLEEVDVDATSRAAAMAFLREYVPYAYEPGIRTIKVAVA